MLKTTLLATLTTALLSTVSIGTEAFVPMPLAKGQNKNADNTVNYNETVCDYYASENIVCDYCLSHTGEHDHKHHFIDANGDGICDHYPVIPEYDSSSNVESPSEYTTGTYSHHNRGYGNSHRKGCHR